MFSFRKCAHTWLGIRGTASKSKSYYDTLNVKPNATQGEIKTAYYELSKLYHPDTNKGSDESLNQFRQITDAYDVLGNVKSRKMYDRGLVVGSSGTILRDDVEDDSTTKFYKQREKRSQVPTYNEGGPTVYDFDAWTKAHYDKSRIRRSNAKVVFDKHVARKMGRVSDKEGDFLLVAISIFLITYAAMLITSEENDIVKAPTKEKVER